MICFDGNGIAPFVVFAREINWSEDYEKTFRQWAGAFLDNASIRSYPSALGMHRTKRPDALQGTLDLLVLKTLSREPQHGYGVAARIQQAL